MLWGQSYLAVVCKEHTATWATLTIS